MTRRRAVEFRDDEFENASACMVRRACAACEPRRISRRQFQRMGLRASVRRDRRAGDAVFGALAQLVAVHGDGQMRRTLGIADGSGFVEVEAALFEKKSVPAEGSTAAGVCRKSGAAAVHRP